MNACGGTNALADASARPGEPCGVCDSGTWTCSGTDAITCAGEFATTSNAALGGSVEASSVFGEAFPVELSVDDDLGTGWFSAGPEGENSDQGSSYTWTGGQVCITDIEVLSLKTHDNESFRAGFGFGSVVVTVYSGEQVVATQITDVSQNDPATASDDDVKLTYDGGIQGDRVVLGLEDHESQACGGFTELIINAVGP